MKTILLIAAIYLIPLLLKAQINDDYLKLRQGLLQKEVRKEFHSTPQYFTVVLETDTLDSYLFINIRRLNFFYKNDTCYKILDISPFDHKEIKKIDWGKFKKVGKSTWFYTDGFIEEKVTFDKVKDLFTTEVIVLNKINKK